MLIRNRPQRQTDKVWNKTGIKYKFMGEDVTFHPGRVDDNNKMGITIFINRKEQSREMECLSSYARHRWLVGLSNVNSNADNFLL